MSAPPSGSRFPPAPGTASLGAWLTLTEPLAGYLLAGSGFDWLCVDEQHGGAGPADTARLIGAVAAAAAAGVSDAAGAAGGPAGAGSGAAGATGPDSATEVLVRVPWNRPEHIGRALDSGARGVIVPMVESAAEAGEAAASCRYPPHGRRSWGPSRTGYAVPGAGAVGESNDRVLCLVMIETPAALDRVEEIAGVPGVDGIFVGPFDLSIALGRPVDDVLADGGPDAPLPRIVAACRAVGVLAGAYAGSVERAAALRDRGFDLLAVASDADLLQSAARAAATDARTRLR
ncbi:HpcH/HpaI aldolase family protein [Planctomonas deserti]|uniref:HpcH/HpaI aldolase family protein n=1 Tax=Planctomonas deserti TaxID=2144185 RepID=UPI000D3DC8D1|nr:aldolase/citrate lyase family protein [Planctomonas deserti]